jgi:3-isopropylmalate dehydrogenase
MVKNPQSLNGIVLWDNIFGDLSSDEAAAVSGSLGFSPSACLAGIPGQEKSTGMCEPSHGSTPDLAPNKANPIATIQSAAMMLRYGCDADFLANAIDEAISVALDDNEAGGFEVRTGELVELHRQQRWAPLLSKPLSGFWTNRPKGTGC